MQDRETVSNGLPGNLGLSMTLQSIADSVEDEILVIDSEYRIRFANSAARNRLQKKADHVEGALCYQIFYDRDRPCRAPLWDCPLRKVLRSGAATTVVHPERAHGAESYLKIAAYPLNDGQGLTRAIVELRRDVTAERQLETQILRRHHQLLTLNHISSAVSQLQDLGAILSIALDHVLEAVSATVGGVLLADEHTGVLRYTVERGLAANLVGEASVMPGHGISGIVAQTGAPIVALDVSQDRRAMDTDLGGVEHLKAFISIPLKSKGKVVGVINVASLHPGQFGADDVSLLTSIADYLGTAIEQARLYERLARVGERYRALLHHALSAQEQERKRIARELHDETSQAITSLTLSLRAVIGIAEMKGIADAEFLQRLNTTHSYAVHAGNEIVKLMKELRPTLLDELGLPAAIQRHAQDTLQAKGIRATTKFVGMAKRLPAEIEVTLFRVAQGLLGNILEHSGAKNTWITMTSDGRECVLRIEDDGKGFDVSKIVRVEPSGRGVGLFTMKERLRLVGGNCHIDSAPGKGTRVTVKIPLANGIIYYEEDNGADS